MNELPSVALVAVLDQLPYRDLVRCRLVNKLWKHLIDHSVSKRELILFVETMPLPNWWEHSGEEVHLGNSIKANYSAFSSEAFFVLFKTVKKLFLSFNHFFFSQKLTDNLAKHFSALEHLQLDFQSSTSLEASTKFRLALKNLKTFCFPKQLLISNADSVTFSLDCDRLTHLYANTDLTLERDSLIARVAPNLRALFVNRITYAKPLWFPHLEILGCCNAPGTQFLLSSLPSLREFHFWIHFASDFNEAKHSINEFLERIRTAQKKVDVFWFGLRFTLENLDRNLDAFSKIRPITPFAPGIESKTLNYFKENSSILNFNYLSHTGDFSVLYSLSFADQLDEHADRELIKSLRNSWNTVFIHYPEPSFDVPKLANLFQLVSRVWIAIDLEQAELNALPEIFSNLRFLFLRVAEHKDLSFVSEFKNLYMFTIGSLVSLTTLDQMLTNCPHLLSIDIGHDHPDKTSIITRRYRHAVPNEGRFRLRLPQNFQRVFEFQRKEQLLGYLDKLNLVLKE